MLSASTDKAFLPSLILETNSASETSIVTHCRNNAALNQRLQYLPQRMLFVSSNHEPETSDKAAEPGNMAAENSVTSSWCNKPLDSEPHDSHSYNSITARCTFMPPSEQQHRGVNEIAQVSNKCIWTFRLKVWHYDCGTASLSNSVVVLVHPFVTATRRSWWKEKHKTNVYNVWRETWQEWERMTEFRSVEMAETTRPSPRCSPTLRKKEKYII